MCVTPLSAPMYKIRAGDDIGELRQLLVAPIRLAGFRSSRLSTRSPVIFWLAHKDDLYAALLLQAASDRGESLGGPAPRPHYSRRSRLCMTTIGRPVFGSARADIASRLTCAGRAQPLAPNSATKSSQYCAWCRAPNPSSFNAVGEKANVVILQTDDAPGAA